MKQSSWQEYRERLLAKNSDEMFHGPLKRYLENEPNIKAVYEEFPFYVTVEGAWEEFDEANALAWKLFGPQDGECNEDTWDAVISCPVVLEIKNEITARGEDVYEITDTVIPEHSHDGCWKQIHLAKTGYDYGYGSFCFRNVLDRELFVSELFKKE